MENYYAEYAGALFEGLDAYPGLREYLRNDYKSGGLIELVRFYKRIKGKDAPFVS